MPRRATSSRSCAGTARSAGSTSRPAPSSSAGRPAALGHRLRRHRAQAGRGADQEPRLPRRPHRPAQPPALQRPPLRGRGPGPPPAHRGWPSSSWTSTASRSSTTRSATAWATGCCRRWRSACRRACARATPWPASGGDEFILLLPGIGARGGRGQGGGEDPGDAEAPRPPRGPRAVRDRQHRASASIPRTGSTSRRLVKNADTAMYRAKEQGRDNFQLYTHAMNETRGGAAGAGEQPAQGARPRTSWSLHYQPLLDLATGQACTAWRRCCAGTTPSAGSCCPREFMHLAEITGLIVPIGPWTLRTACAQAQALAGAGASRACTVAVNLSARQFQQPDLVDAGQARAATRPACPPSLASTSRSPRPTPCRTRRRPSRPCAS